MDRAPSFTIEGHGNDKAVEGKKLSELSCLLRVWKGNPSKGTKGGSKERDSIGPFVATRGRRNHERPRKSFRGRKDVGVKVSNEGFVKPPKVVGGASMALEN